MSAVNLTVTQNTKHPENIIDHHQNENGQFLSAHGRVPGLRGAASLAKIYAITGVFCVHSASCRLTTDLVQLVADRWDQLKSLTPWDLHFPPNIKHDTTCGGYI